MFANLIGRPKAELDTPSLTVDLDAFEQNVDKAAAFLASKNKQWRPHAKCHKSPVIAHRLLRAGAIGVTCAKVSEAEVFAQAGIRDILIANAIVGSQKLERVASLTHWADPVIVVDHFVQAEALAAMCRKRGTTCRVILEVNIGMNRVGIRPGTDTRELAQGVAKLPGIRLVGIMGYEGHLLALSDPEEKAHKIRNAIAILEETRDTMLQDGIECSLVSAGGTGSIEITSECAAPTELQSGAVIFADPFYSERCGLVGYTPALRLIATVVSRGKLERGILDAGRKTLHPDTHPSKLIGTVEGRPLNDAVIASLNAEHGILELGPQSQDLRIGDKVEIIPGYCDFTMILHRALFGIRGGLVETVWPIPGRGCLQ
ncbi:D-threonine aldolase [Caulifigura coniformis]|uniref:D-threonine aldolase n=1 Tax=Caulifigura coniformis TaxID=2527983 RepID=A0A517SM16_9PLAN|nr:DSD1 family PLP-dependent enzyme [Caulifigura coniformis]QDT57158.1 D-threonine aldolase [Caulifigura coniformis]